MSDERVLCIPRSWFLHVTGGGFTGYRPFDAAKAPPEEHLLGLLSSPDIALLPRSLVETNPEWKQIVTYVVALGPPPNTKPLAYTRSKAGGEARLHKLRSIGVGGHVNKKDAPWWAWSWTNSVRKGAEREVREELKPAKVHALIPTGIVNDETNQVGTVHVGVVYSAFVEGPFRYGDEVQDADWLDWTAPGFSLDGFETWSGHILRTLAIRAASQSPQVPPWTLDAFGLNTPTMGA